MAIIVMLGFEARYFGEFSNTSAMLSGISFDTAVYHTSVIGGRHGSASLKCSKTGATGVYYRVTGVSSTGAPAAYSIANAYTSFWARLTANPSSQLVIASWKNTGGSVKASLKLNTDGTLSLYDLNSNLLATSAGTITDGDMHCVEVKIGTGSAGACAWSFDLDNSSVGSGSSATLSSTNNGYFDLGPGGGENVTIDCWFDDVVISDSAFVPYDSVVGLLKPTGNSAVNTGYTASSGNKYACVGEGPPPSATNYVRATVAGNVYTATMEASSTIMGADDTIVAVAPIIGHSQ